MKDYESSTMLFYQPKMLTNEDLKATEELFFSSQLNHGNFNLEDYFLAEELHIVKNYESKEIFGFLCSNINQVPFPFDFIYIKNKKTSYIF